MTVEGSAQVHDWEALGAGEAEQLADRHALVVTGTDVHAAARVALGFGRAASATRRVAIADLADEVPELQSLVPGDDPHGIVDSFLYGVSLNKIARPVDDRGMLFVMPTGSEPIVGGEILRNERWHRLASGFREVGALLLLVVPADRDGAAELLAMVDGAIVVGDAATSGVPAERIAAVVPRPSTPEPTPIETPAVATPPAIITIPPPVDELPAEGPVEPAPARRTPTSPRFTPAMSGEVAAAAAPSSRRPLLLAGLLVAAIAVWFLAGRPGLPAGDDGLDADTITVPRDSAARGDSAAPAAPAAAAPASAASESALVARVDSLRALLPANPQDSLRATTYGVVLLATNDEAQALAKWATQAMGLPGGTVSAVSLRGEKGTWYQVQAGAFGKPAQAESLLVALRDSGVVAAETGRVVATPFAIVLEENVGRRAARAVADGYRQRQVAAYPLLQPDGRATIYVGAFETPDAAAPLLAALRARGIAPTLVYRTGRSF